LTIVPRGRALGFMRKSPQNDQYLYTCEELEKQIMVALAGAIAEEIEYGNRSTGAQNDYIQAWDIAKQIVETGLSTLGVVNCKDMPQDTLYQECQKIINELDKKTQEILNKNQKQLILIAKYVLSEETIDRTQFIEMLESA